jgi:hypothetical protein
MSGGSQERRGGGEKVTDAHRERLCRANNCNKRLFIEIPAARGTAVVSIPAAAKFRLPTNWLYPEISS